MLEFQILAKILPEHDLDPKGDPMENLRIWHLGVEEMATLQMFLKPSHYDTMVKKVCACVIVPYSLMGHTRASHSDANPSVSELMSACRNICNVYSRLKRDG